MRQVDLDGSLPFHRFLTPRWAHAPLSGAGAAQQGGRFNRPGTEALYLAQDVSTAQAEYAQGALWGAPGLHCVYRIRAQGIADLSLAHAAETLPQDWADMLCDWKQIARIEGRDPPSWRIADALLARGVPGLLYPSSRRTGGICLVLFLDTLRASSGSVAAHDPEGRLPRDAQSWP